MMQNLTRTPSGIHATGKIVLCAGVLGLFVLVSGCAREVATTTIKADGSWTRQVAIHTPKPDKNAGGGAPGMGEVKPEDVFVLPGGPKWKITKSEKDSDAIYTAERTLTLSEAVSGDISIKREGDKSVVVVNQVTVKQVSPGRFVYTETFTWKGPKPKELSEANPDEIASIKAALPAKLATEANIKALSVQITRLYWRVMFGPGQPLISHLSEAMMEPERVEQRILRQTGAEMERVLADKFGDQLTGEQRRSTSRKILHDMLEQNTKKTQDPKPGGGEELGGVPPITLSIFLKMPGKITQSNGEADNEGGEVYWSLYPQAAALGDVTLTATCDAK